MALSSFFAAPAQGLDQLLFEATAVWQVGHGIDPRHAIDRAGGVAPFGDVLDDDDRALPLPRHAVDGDLDRAVVARLERRDHVDPGGGPRQRLPHPLDLVLGDNLATQQRERDGAQARARLEIVCAEVKQVEELAVDDCDATFGVDHQQSVRHVVERHVEALGEQSRLALSGHDGQEIRPQAIRRAFHVDAERDKPEQDRPGIVSARHQHRRAERHESGDDLQIVASADGEAACPHSERV